MKEVSRDCEGIQYMLDRAALAAASVKKALRPFGDRLPAVHR